MPRTKTENTKYLREWRKNTQKEKRFNKPLREYMELKHRDHYNEYCHFFKTLIENHPAAKDLTRTSTYKKWKRRQLNCEASDTETTETETTETETKPTEPFEPEAEIAPPEHVESQAEPENEYPDILTMAVQETLPPDNIDINQLDNRIQQIIDELEQNDALRGLFNEDQLVQDADEGIALDVESELEAIIEPFDFELEVDF